MQDTPVIVEPDGFQKYVRVRTPQKGQIGRYCPFGAVMSF